MLAAAGGVPASPPPTMASGVVSARTPAAETRAPSTAMPVVIQPTRNCPGDAATAATPQLGGLS